jgi:hypothetical protein
MLAAGCRIPDVARGATAADSLAVAHAFADAVRRGPVGTPYSVSWPAGGPAWSDTARALLSERYPRPIIITGMIWQVQPDRLEFHGDTARLTAIWHGCNLAENRPAGPNVRWSEHEYLFVRRSARWVPVGNRQVRAGDGSCVS